MDTLAHELAPYMLLHSWWVACSGGRDSMVLLDVLSAYSKIKSCPSIRVVHIHHGLQEFASSWAAQLLDYCNNKKLSFTIYFLKPAHKFSSIESWAREQRYAIFEKIVKKNDTLLMAHHANDQAETFLWHAIRGSGLDGLSGIPKERSVGQGMLLRPFLELPQSVISQYQIETDLQFSQDPSNSNEAFTRNKIRHRVIPLLEEAWPHLVKSLNQNTQLLTEQKYLLEKYLRPIFFNLLDDMGLCLNIKALLSYEISEQAWCIRFWLKSLSLSVLDFKCLRELLRQLKSDNQLVFSFKDNRNFFSIRRYQNKLFLLRALPEIPVNQEWDWQHHFLDLQGTMFCAKSLFSDSQIQKLTPEPIDVRFGEPGETIKKFWQTQCVPPWCRKYSPIFYQNNCRLSDVNYLAIYSRWHDCLDIHKIYGHAFTN